jgi:hypothetical protein
MNYMLTSKLPLYIHSVKFIMRFTPFFETLPNSLVQSFWHHTHSQKYDLLIFKKTQT